MRRRLSVVDDDGDGVTGDNDYDDFDDAADFAVVAMANGVVALIAMASLPLPMRRRLAIVNDDGDSATGDKVNDDGNGATGDDVDDDGEGATYDDIYDDCDGATGDEVDNDCDGAKGDEVGDNGNGARNRTTTTMTKEVKAKLQGGVGGGATTGATRQPAGKQEANVRGGIQDKREGRRQRTRGGGAPRGREAAAAGGTM